MTKITIQKEDVNSYFVGHWEDFFSHYAEIQIIDGINQYIHCPFHSDKNKPSLSFRSDTGIWKCFGCGEKGDGFKFYGLLRKISEFPEILEGIGQDFGINGSGLPRSSGKPSGASKKGKGQIVETYDYTDEKGVLLFQVVRYDPKDFRQRRPDGKGGWIWDLKGVSRVLLHLPDVIKHSAVVITEGERDANNVRKKLGLMATTCAGGAEKWKEEYNKYLAGKDVVVLTDNDEPGRKHGESIAKSLKDVARSVRVLDLPGLPEKGDITDWIQSGGTTEELKRLAEECPLWESEETPIALAKRLYPRRAFPWEALPSSIATSLRQLARSCASSPTSLPGAAIAIFSSLIGSVVSVSPKLSWTEPLIFWISDIRPSGTGKTPAGRILCQVLHDAQSKADEKYRVESEKWQALSTKEKGETDPPDRPRGYFITDLTIEGLRTDHSGHGGSVCVLDELSAFLSAQNQYKAKKGSDRESWLTLWEGKPARIVRAGRSQTISNSRINIFGGVQPGVWTLAFSGEDGQIFLIDGTIYRFLPTFEGDAFYPLTRESWSEENREEWEDLLKIAMRWADAQQVLEETKRLCLSDGAQQTFLDWRNVIMQVKDDLPAPVRGFIPKSVSYALRFAGVFCLMDAFSRDQTPGVILNESDIKKGIKVSEFYLGHIIQAMEALASEGAQNVFEITEQVRHLARTLEAMEPELDNGRLAVGYIQERFNADAERGLWVHSSRSMGSLLRKCGLTIQANRSRANGRTGVHCLVWDERINYLIEKTSTMSTKSTEP